MRAQAATDAMTLPPGSPACVRDPPALRPELSRQLIERLHTSLQCHEAPHTELASTPSHPAFPKLGSPAEVAAHSQAATAVLPLAPSIWTCEREILVLRLAPSQKHLERCWVGKLLFQAM